MLHTRCIKRSCASSRTRLRLRSLSRTLCCDDDIGVLPRVGRRRRAVSSSYSIKKFRDLNRRNFPLDRRVRAIEVWLFLRWHFRQRRRIACAR